MRKIDIYGGPFADPAFQANSASRTRGIALSIHRIAKAEEIGAAIDAAKASNVAAIRIEKGWPLHVTPLARYT